MYYKQQKLSKSEVLWFTGFHLHVKKTCAVFVLIMLSFPKALIDKAFTIHQKPTKIEKLSSHIASVVYGI